MDNSLATLKKCVQLSLSTNNIEKIGSLAGLECLKILSLGKNQIKKLENLDGVAATLEELWISYNLIERLTNIDKLPNLRVLYMSNNKIENFKELDKLAPLANLAELLLVGNPLYPSAEKPEELGCEYRIEGQYFSFTTFRRLIAHTRLTLSFLSLSPETRAAAGEA